MLNGTELGERENVVEDSLFVPEGLYWGRVLEAQTSQELRSVLQNDVAERAVVHEDENHPFNSNEPFIIYEPMNRKPEGWVAVAMARIAQLELGLDPDEPVLIFGIPRSAKWMVEQVVKAKVFPNAEVVLVAKSRELIPDNVDVSEADILSYVHNRQISGSRGAETMYFADPGSFLDRHVLGFEDVIAEGKTIEGVAECLYHLGVSRFDVAATLSKGLIQGGTSILKSCQSINNLVEGVKVSDVLGSGEGQLLFE